MSVGLGDRGVTGRDVNQRLYSHMTGRMVEWGNYSTDGLWHLAVHMLKLYLHPSLPMLYTVTQPPGSFQWFVFSSKYGKDTSPTDNQIPPET
jgi:hypothetical protein